MDLKWSYYLIVIIYFILIALEVLNKKKAQEFKKNHEKVQQYKAYKKDFFTTVAKICLVLSVIINGLCLYGGNALNWNSLIITVAIIGMALITSNIQILVSEEGEFNIGGLDLNATDIKDFETKKRKNRTKNSIVFQDTINGYEGIEFYLNEGQSDKFLENIK